MVVMMFGWMVVNTHRHADTHRHTQTHGHTQAHGHKDTHRHLEVLDEFLAGDGVVVDLLNDQV